MNTVRHDSIKYLIWKFCITVQNNKTSQSACLSNSQMGNDSIFQVIRLILLYFDHQTVIFMKHVELCEFIFD